MSSKYGTVPLIGSKGLFQLKEPYKNLITKGVNYECVAVRKFIDVLSDGVNIYQKYYAPRGLDESVYQSDLNNGAYLISLKSASSEWVYVPSTYVLTYPGMTGVRYSCVLLGVNLGALPVKTDLSLIKAKIAEIVQGELGVRSTVEEVVISAEEVLTHEDHQRLEAARAAAIVSNASYYTQVKQLQALNTQLQAKNVQLTQYILANQP